MRAWGHKFPKVPNRVTLLFISYFVLYIANSLFYIRQEEKIADKIWQCEPGLKAELTYNDS